MLGRLLHSTMDLVHMKGKADCRQEKQFFQEMFPQAVLPSQTFPDSAYGRLMERYRVVPGGGLVGGEGGCGVARVPALAEPFLQSAEQTCTAKHSQQLSASRIHVVQCSAVCNLPSTRTCVSTQIHCLHRQDHGLIPGPVRSCPPPSLYVATNQPFQGRRGITRSGITLTPCISLAQ